LTGETETVEKSENFYCAAATNVNVDAVAQQSIDSTF